MLTINPNHITHQKLHQYMQGSIAPRPIALVSSIDEQGTPNLSPFSFFNAFGVNPTTIIFSPSRRGRDNTVKNTYENVKAVPEVVINMVTYDMVHQVSLASTEYPKGVNEFTKSGLTMLKSDIIAPYRVAESPVQYECKVRQVIETSDTPGAANLVICEVLLLHIDEKILDANGQIDPDKVRLVGRMGKDFYTRAFGDALFEVQKPLEKLGLGVDKLPESVRFSKILTGNDLGILGNIDTMPEENEIKEFCSQPEIQKVLHNAGEDSGEIHRYAQTLIQQGKARQALMLLLCRISAPGRY